MLMREDGRQRALVKAAGIGSDPQRLLDRTGRGACKVDGSGHLCAGRGPHQPKLAPGPIYEASPSPPPQTSPTRIPLATQIDGKITRADATKDHGQADRDERPSNPDGRR